MAEEQQNTEITAKEVRGVPFMKGDDPRRNLDGRPVGAKSFTTKVKEALMKIAEGKNYTYEEAFIRTILKKGIVDGDSVIIRLIWNYLDGMPLQKTDLTSLGKEIIPIFNGQSKENGTLPEHNSDQKDIQPPQEDQGSGGGDECQQDNLDSNMADRLRAKLAE